MLTLLGVRQVLWLDPGAGIWSCVDSDNFYINLALRSADDARYDGKRPRLRVRKPSPQVQSLAHASA